MCRHQCNEGIGSSLYRIEIDHKTSGACTGAQFLSLNLLTFYQSEENLEKPLDSVLSGDTLRFGCN